MVNLRGLSDERILADLGLTVDLIGRRIFRIDPRTNRVKAIRVGRTPRSVAASDTAIWVSNHLSNTVSRINPRTLKVVATIKVGKKPENAAIADDGTVFVPNLGSNTLSRIDPATNKVVNTLSVGTKPFPAANASATSGCRAPAAPTSCACTSAELGLTAPQR
jgi:YVTN family beta-propeller protein